MPYFKDNYSGIKYPIAEDGKPGLRLAQLGAIHAISAHFSLRQDSGLIVMPTGSGKTVVLMMTGFVLRANRALIVTPSRLVRNQIFNQFKVLSTLREAKVVDDNLPNPSVHEVKTRVSSIAEWNALRSFDVVIGIPNSISPAIVGIPPPPADLFDLILVDEAHHSPATTWSGLFEAFPNARRVLFTATPFRRDDREIIGKLLFHYSIKDAYRDKAFGKIEYIAVNPQDGVSNDILIAKEAERQLQADRGANLKHFLMVRTDSRKRANELKTVYARETRLRLGLIHSGHTYRHIITTIDQLKAGGLEGIICVNMLGEGFDFPNLKIAAIHAPHRSLEITLQFIGRFARTAGTEIGEAKFLAVPSEIEIQKAKLYREGAVWQEIIADLSHSRIDREEKIRKALETFAPPTKATFNTEDVSLYALTPYNHVKIYRVTDLATLNVEPVFRGPYEMVYQQNSDDQSAVVIITRETERPRWTDLDVFFRAEYDLFIVFLHKPSKLLFINSSRRNDTIYEELARQYSRGPHRILSLYRINKVLIGLKNPEFFNIGMKNRLLNSNTESYRIIAGSRAQKAVVKTDGRLYHRGHVFCRAESDGERITIGYSSASKVWSNTNSQIPELIEWCKKLAERIDSNQQVNTGSELDFLPVGEEVREIPEGIIAVEWNQDAFSNPMAISYIDDGGREKTAQLLDLGLTLNRAQCNKGQIEVVLSGDGLVWPVRFSLSGNAYFTLISHDQQQIFVVQGRERMLLLDYVNNNPLDFYFADFSRMQGGERFVFPKGDFSAFDMNQISVLEWKANNCDIENEVSDPQTVGTAQAGTKSIHNYLAEYLLQGTDSFVFYDHGSREVADFLTAREVGEEIVISLYHCKGSGGPNAGHRVDDVYEVCGQAVKSQIWLDSISDLVHVVEDRINRGSRFLKGKAAGLTELAKGAAAKRVIVRMVLAQPGISKAGLPDKLQLPLAAANDYVQNYLSTKLTVLASA